MTSQFVLRVAILGFIALAMFSIIFLRLWYLQVLSGNKYVEAAQNNRVREFQIVAPRGEIQDRNGNVLVGNRTALSLQVETDKMPSGEVAQHAEFRRLGQVIGLDASQVEHKIEADMKE